MNRVPAKCCPWCGALLDCATPLQPGSAPKPGDFTLCIYCATALRFTDDLSVRRLLPEDSTDFEQVRAGVEKAQRLLKERHKDCSFPKRKRD